MSNIATKIIIANSLENLLSQRPFNEITVTDVVKECGLTRTTFYRHFIDINDLVSWTYRYNVDKIIKQNADINHLTAHVEAICFFIYKKRDFIRSICQYNGQNSFIEFLYDYSMEYLTNMLNKANTTIDKTLLDSMKFYVSGAVYTDYRWITKNFEETPKEIAEIICNNLPASLRQYFANKSN